MSNPANGTSHNMSEIMWHVHILNLNGRFYPLRQECTVDASTVEIAAGVRPAIVRTCPKLRGRALKPPTISLKAADGTELKCFGLLMRRGDLPLGRGFLLSMYPLSRIS